MFKKQKRFAEREKGRDAFRLYFKRTAARLSRNFVLVKYPFENRKSRPNKKSPRFSSAFCPWFTHKIYAPPKMSDFSDAYQIPGDFFRIQCFAARPGDASSRNAPPPPCSCPLEEGLFTKKRPRVVREALCFFENVADSTAKIGKRRIKI